MEIPIFAILIGLISTSIGQLESADNLLQETRKYILKDKFQIESLTPVVENHISRHDWAAENFRPEKIIRRQFGSDEHFLASDLHH